VRRTNSGAALRNALDGGAKCQISESELPTVLNVLVLVHSSSVQFSSLEREAHGWRIGSSVRQSANTLQVCSFLTG
jgi:hypothetical protein